MERARVDITRRADEKKGKKKVPDAHDISDTLGNYPTKRTMEKRWRFILARKGSPKRQGPNGRKEGIRVTGTKEHSVL